MGFTVGQEFEQYCETKDGGLSEELWSRETKNDVELPEDPNFTALGVEVSTDEKLDIIPEVVLKFCPNMNAIYITNSKENGFENLEQNLFEYSFPKIIYFTIGECKITRGSLKTVGPDALKNLPNLIEAEIILNKVDSISPTAFKTNKKLKKISITDNFLTALDSAIFQGLTALRVIKVAANKIENLPETIFQGLDNLLVANFQQNKLKSLPGKLFVGLKNLTIINFSRNRLEELPVNLFQDLEKLQKVDFSYNALKVIAGDFLKSNKLLKDANFSSNQISVIDPTAFKTLNSLASGDFQRNLLTKIDEVFVRKFNKTNLSYNKISEIPESLKNQDRFILDHQNSADIKTYDVTTEWAECPDIDDEKYIESEDSGLIGTTFGTIAQVPKVFHHEFHNQFDFLTVFYFPGLS